MHVKDKDGTEQSLDLQIATKSDAPMVVQVERQVSDNSVLSRSIVSGTVIASKSDGSIEATYTNLKVSLASDECKVASGSASFVFKDSAGTTLKTYTLSVDSTSGDSVLKDDSGNSVDDFAIDACDAEDLKI